MSKRTGAIVAATIFLVLGALALFVAVTQALSASTYRGSQPLPAEVVEVAGLDRAVGPTVRVLLLGSQQEVELTDASASEYSIGQSLVVYRSTSSSAPTFTDASGYSNASLAGGGSLASVLCGFWHIRRARTAASIQ